jgi:phosphoheptose isomerase
MTSLPEDPRHRNETLDWSSVDAYKRSYAQSFKDALDGVASDEVEKLCEAVLTATQNGRQIFVIGNGGSASVAEHLCCDWTKGTQCEGHPIIKSRSLNSNGALFSALANDYGYEHVFDSQIGFFGEEGDILIAVSSSGNSPNIINAVEAAKRRRMIVAGLSGFKGGALREICDIPVYVASSNYGIVEDVHQSIMHIIAQYIACRRDNPENRQQ